MSKRADLLKQRIKKRMAELKWDQADLAKALNTQQSAISRYLSGHHVPRLDFLERIAEALSVSPESLIALEGTPTPVVVREPTPEEVAVLVIDGLKIERRRADLVKMILTLEDPLALESLEVAALPFKKVAANKKKPSVG